MLRHVLACALLAAAALAVAPTAQAQDGVLVCLPPTSSSLTFDPPLTATPQTVTVRSTNLFGPCASTSEPAITAGVVTGEYLVGGRSCATLAGSGSSTSTVVRNTGQTSGLTLTFTTTIVGAVYTSVVTGTVTSGLFQGRSVVSNQTGPATDVLACTLGLGSVAGIHTVGTISFV